VSGFIQELIRSGNLVLWHDYRAGHTQDLSQNNSNNGVINGNCVWEGNGLRFVDATAYVEVPHHASLNVTDATIVMLKPKRRNYALGIGSPNLGYFVKEFGGAGLILRVYLNANRLAVHDGANARWSGIAYNDDERYVGMSSLAGTKIVGYREGVSIGLFNDVSSIPTSTHNVYIGICAAAMPYLGTMQSVMLINRVLTAAEHAQLYDELANLRWPTKFYASAKRTQGSYVGESGLLAGFNLKPAGGVVPSQVGAFTGTMSGDVMYQSGILGDGFAMGRTDGAVDLDVGNADIDPTTDSHWLEIWARPLDVAMSDIYVPIIGKGGVGVIFYRAPGISHLADRFRAGWSDSGGGLVVVDAMNTVHNKHTHLVLTCDHTNHEVYLYVDGVQFGPTAITTMAALQAHNWKVGKFGTTLASFDGGFGGLTVCPRIGTGVLTPAQVQARYLEGARAIQFQTDWGFQVSPAAEGGVLHQQIGGGASPFRAGDTSFRGKIETDTVNGRLCKVLTCTTAGVVYVPTELFFDASPTECAFGTWDLWAYKADASVFDMNLISNLSTGITTGYGIQWAADESVVVTEYGVGNLVAGGTASHSTWHRFRLTRSSAGIFIPYIDGVTFGTSAAELTTTTASYMLFDMDLNDRICLGNIQGDDALTKYLGVVAP